MVFITFFLLSTCRSVAHLRSNELTSFDGVLGIFDGQFLTAMIRINDQNNRKTTVRRVTRDGTRLDG